MHFNPNFTNPHSHHSHSHYSQSHHSHDRSRHDRVQHESQPNEALNEGNKAGAAPSAAASSIGSTTGLQLGEPKEAQDVANTMLQHVQKGLDQLRTQGASEERIQQRLQAAKEGIAKGYAQAEQQLKDMGLLDDDLKADIAQGRGLIDAGLEAMASGVVVSEAVAAEASNSYQQQSRQENTMSLELMTRDGDKVSLSFTQSGRSFYAATQTGQQQVSLSGFEQNRDWQMDVVGSLDEGELEALSSLLQDVEKLSTSFFSGDLGKALQQAMELGFDGDELASMSLNLRQESFSSVSRAYNSVQPKLPTPQLESLSSPLLAYNDYYLSALEQAKSFADPEQLINDLVDQLFPDDHLKGIFQAYNQGLYNALENRASLMGELIG